MNKPVAPEHLQRRFAIVTELPQPQLKPCPPRVEPCPYCKGEGVGCQEDCWTTGRRVEGGQLPGPLATADYLRATVAAEMAAHERHRALTPEQMDELCVHAESCDAASQRIARLESEIAELRGQR